MILRVAARSGARAPSRSISAEAAAHAGGGHGHRGTYRLLARRNPRLAGRGVWYGLAHRGVTRWGRGRHFVGGGNSAGQAAVFLSGHASQDPA